MLEPMTLTWRAARLEPLSPAHADDLALLSDDPDLWRYMGFGTLAKREDLDAFIAEMALEPARGVGLNFAIIETASGRAVGSTSLCEVSLRHERAEIGRTWIGAPYQRTAINTECKLMLLTYAFETLGVVRVQLKTDLRNVRSQNAIERLGAVREGVLRAHMLLHDGSRRDTVMYSILADEWPGVKTRLTDLLARYNSAV
jgi:N-acetyltransferase